jgi:hypothetical protein
MSEATDKCQRWRKITLDQLTYALNLTLTFSVAALGFCFALLRDGTFIPAPCAKLTMMFSMASLTLSAIAGFLCTVNRLHDFRGTARLVCNHSQPPSRDELRDLGNLTWRLFYFQLWTFGIGVIALAITLLLTDGHKLV